MKSIKNAVTIEHTVNRSRFIGLLARATTETEAMAFLEQEKKNYPDANHHCYAYIIGEGLTIQKATDDKEPSKTAGVPLLEILKKNELTDVIVIATRYFGGVKLGSGGLIRAYAKTAKLLVENAEFAVKTTYDNLVITIDYQHSTNVERLIRSEATEYVSSYLENVSYNVTITHDKYLKFVDMIKDITSGSAKIDHINTESGY